jgi:uracil phosphoribosyltransferase
MPLHIIAHPLASHIMTHLRDVTTKPATFRTLCYQLSLLLAIEATADLPTEDKPIQTPLEPMTGRVLTHQPLVVVPILRAGLGGGAKLLLQAAAARGPAGVFGRPDVGDRR